MSESRLVNRNVIAERGRTSMRLEPELWDALTEICARERIDVGELVRRVEAERPSGGRTSAVRVYIVKYFRKSAETEGRGREDRGAPDPAGRQAAPQPFAA